MYSYAEAAQFSALVMYGWDMCDANLHCLSPTPDLRIAGSGWNVVGYITGGDKIIKSGNGIRNKILGVSYQNDDRVCYGYLAKNLVNDYVAVSRGTDGAEEWFDDLDFIPCHPNAPLQGKVDGGFYSIYQTMQFNTLEFDGSYSRLPLAEGIAKFVDFSPVSILGHSLGAALATYLIAELSVLIDISQLDACLFASPKPGDDNFSTWFSLNIQNYQVFNYKKDIVPMTPPLGYSALQNCTILQPNQDGLIISPHKTCCHHLICYIALLDPVFYGQLIAMPEMTADDKNCDACVLLE